MAKLEIGIVQDPLNWQHWPVARTMLTPALAQSDEDWASVEAELSADTMQLVGVLSKGGGQILAAAVTRSVQTVRGEVLEIYLCGGRGFQEWALPLAKLLRDGARLAGMVGTRIIGRKGWERVLAPLGFKQTLIVLEAA